MRNMHYNRTVFQVEQLSYELSLAFLCFISERMLRNFIQMRILEPSLLLCECFSMWLLISVSGFFGVIILFFSIIFLFLYTHIWSFTSDYKILDVNYYVILLSFFFFFQSYCTRVVWYDQNAFVALFMQKQKK